MNTLPVLLSILFLFASAQTESNSSRVDFSDQYYMDYKTVMSNGSMAIEGTLYLSGFDITSFEDVTNGTRGIYITFCWGSNTMYDADCVICTAVYTNSSEDRFSCVEEVVLSSTPPFETVELTSGELKYATDSLNWNGNDTSAVVTFTRVFTVAALNAASLTVGTKDAVWAIGTYTEPYVDQHSSRGITTINLIDISSSATYVLSGLLVIASMLI